MALIKCPECNKEISDECKVCIHCGYTLKKEKEEKKEKINILAPFKSKKEILNIKNFITLTGNQIMAIVCLLCSFVVSLFPVCYGRFLWPSISAGMYTSRYSESLFNVLIDTYVGNYTLPMFIAFFVLSLVAILLFNKLKRKIFVYIPNVLYFGVLVYLLIEGNLYIFYSTEYVSFIPAFAVYYMTGLALLSVGFLVLDIIIRRPKKNSQ